MNRSTYAILALATIGLGLLLRAGHSALPSSVADVGGDALWAAMMFWWVSTVWPRAGPLTRAVGALAVAWLVELSQLVRTPWLDGIRATTLGYLVLGSGFDGRDFISYALGAAAAVLLDLMIGRRHAPKVH
ncbi:MAG: DUF2809 domain-containing protein [Gemmatimonadota bacterium]